MGGWRRDGEIAGDEENRARDLSAGDVISRPKPAITVEKKKAKGG